MYLIDKAFAAPPTSTIVVANNNLGIGKTSQVTITFSEAVIGFAITDMTAENGILTDLATSDNTTYTATLTPAAGVVDDSNIITLDNALVTDKSGSNAGTGITQSNNYSVDTVRPTVTTVDVPGPGMYKTGDNLDFTVNFGENVTVNTAGGTPQMPLTIGSKVVNAEYVSGSGTSALVFRYTVQSGDLDSNGIAVGTPLNANGGTLQDGAGNDANLALNNIADTTSVLVEAVPPVVTGVVVPSSGTYKTGDTMGFTVSFSETVIVNTAGGTPYLPLTIGSTAVNAPYVSGSGSNALTFRYTVQSGDNDADGIAVGADLSTNGGVLRDGVGNNASLTLNGVGSTAAVLVDAAAPEVGSVSVPANGTYKAGDNLDFTVNFGENVTVDTTGGTPQLPLTIGSTGVNAPYVSGSGTSALLFRYTVQSGDLDADGISVGAALGVNGGTLRDSAGNNAILTLNGVGSTAAVLVDAAAPAVTSVGVPANGTYKAGMYLAFIVKMSEPVVVNMASGTAPTIDLKVGDTIVKAVYESSLDSTELLFRYQVRVQDQDADGIQVVSTAIDPSGATINDAAGNPADLTLNHIGATQGIMVSNTLTVALSHTGWTNQSVTATVYSDSGSRVQYKIGESGEWTDYSAPVVVEQEGITAFYARAAGSDSVGEAVSAEIKIDKTAPVLTLVGDETITLYLGDDYVEKGALASDSLSGISPLSVTGSVNTGKIGTYPIHYSVADLTGNQAQDKVRTVKVVPKPTGLRFNSAAYSIVEGNEAAFQLIIGYSDNQEIDVTKQGAIQIADPEIVGLSSIGKWKALKYGQTVVTAVYDNKTASATVTVAPALKGISFAEPSYRVEINKDQQTAVNAAFSDGSISEITALSEFSLSSEIATISEAGKITGRAVGTGVLEATYGGLKAQTQVTVYKDKSNRSTGTGNKADTRQAKVEVGTSQSRFETISVQFEITRIWLGQQKADQVIMSGKGMEEAAASMQSGQNTMRIVIDGLPEDPADVVNIVLPARSASILAERSVTLEIKTENAAVTVPNDALKGLSGDQDYYFNIAPVKKDEERQAVKERIVNADEVRAVAKAGDVEVLGTPMNIETNLPKVPVKVTFPIDGAAIPADPAQRELFLQTLSVFIEHSDGEKVLQRGKIVFDVNGYPSGIQIQIDKFSTFTIVSIKNEPLHREPYILGYPDGTFRPNEPVTRAEMSVMLSRLLQKSTEKKTAASDFSDVDPNYWAAESIQWGQAAGLLSGYPDQTFRPSAPITRAEMTSIIGKWLKLDNNPSKPSFKDTAGHWASGQIEAVYQKGIMTGYEDGSFAPDRSLSRAEAVVIINRILHRVPQANVSVPTWSDVPPDFWAFPDIEEAS
ncbi:S-layer homology domain-containing protein [Paenibacillus hamazuiensis]|uniref:S-layer homology domain-containing protein n=1 Tax=Paenibacillus hamazuiensis TaxID=2936508 RepID=UPI00200DC50A|nr:S-layer homology domain-containing protein [Paenibacillus hamazuiensis]